jgi:transcriptional regulator with XRE-family HTH domain
MLPFGRIELKGRKSKLFSDSPVTLGEHLRKRRHELGLFQREVAERLGVDPHSVSDWEKDHKHPEIRFWPAVIAFLGYDPNPKPHALGERLRAKRRRLGISIAAAAARLGVDEGTFSRWERELRRPLGNHERLIGRFLAS